MACACNKKRQVTGFAAARTPAPSAGGRVLPVPPTTFSLRKPNGTVETYGSKLEALAARAREGGTLIG